VPPTFDVVVAGAGHNSLVAAAYLAKAGYEVCVLEARGLIGGDTCSEELNLPGFLHDTCSTFQPTLMGSPVLRDDELGLVADYGLELVRPELGCHMPFPDGSSITQYLDPQRTWESIAAINRRDADAYSRMCEEWDAVKGDFGRASNTPIGSGPALDELLAARPDGRRWQRRVAMSGLDVVRHEFEDERVQSFMAWMALQTLQPIQRPGTGALAFSVAANRQQHGWLVFKGGTGVFAEALGRLIRDCGGTVLTSRQVTRLVLEGGRCTGVETADGERYTARKAVLSTIHVKQLVEMAPADAWYDDFRFGVDTWRNGGTLFVTYCALSEPLPWPAFGPGVPLRRLLRIGHDWETGTVSTDDPSLLVVCTSLVDPSRAPAGQHVLKVLGMQPYDIAGGPERWDDLKDEVSEANLAQVRRYAPGLTAETILATTVKSPLDLERTNAHNWHGSCHGGDASPSQTGRFRFHQRTPIPGLYQTGATTHPGGSVTAGPGRNAARVLLEDLGRTFDEAVAR
jgi:phytoene dehydrogenase-like protein